MMKIQCLPSRVVRRFVLTIFCLSHPLITALRATEPGSPAAVYAGAVPGGAPRYWLEHITHPDLSGSRILAFQTIPGVNYTVEASKDLQSWEVVGSHEGGGQQVLVPMVQTEPPPAPSPPPADPPPPLLHTWMMMQKASTSGIVLYWHSTTPLENGRLRLSFQSHHFPNLTLDPAWDGHFIYLRKFDGFSFAITHPRSLSVAPPDPVHSTEDLAMLAAFEENFPTMNQEVHDQIAAVRHIPPPAPPPDPNGRGFFRVRADWSADSDGDSVPDWEELAMMAGVAGVGADGTLLVNAAAASAATMADPTKADSNNNGIPDHKELDFDEDTIPRSEDAAPMDGAIAWRKTRPTRYALFDLPVRTGTYGNVTPPIDVNSQGMVLYDDGVFYGNVFHPLPAAEGVNYPIAHAINDSGAVLGQAAFDYPDVDFSGIALWSCPSGAPALVSAGETRADSTYDMHYGQLAFASCFASDGSFIANAWQPVAGSGPGVYENIGPHQWSPGGGGAHGFTPVDLHSRYCGGNGVHWGSNGTGEVLFTGPGGITNFGSANFTNYTMVEGISPVLSGGTSLSRFFVQNTWKHSPTLGTVCAISETGIANVWNAPASEKIPPGLGFWMNDRFLNLETLVPGFPVSYKNWPHDTIKGMADKGHFILTRSAPDGYTLAESAIGYPCAVEDHVSDVVRLALRDNDSDTMPFTGVDDVSITASAEDPSAHNKIWIMAPIGASGGNDAKMHIPVSTDNPATLSAPMVDGEIEVSALGQPVVFAGTGTGTTDGDLTIKLGTASAANAPIAIKAMKRRTVRVTVTPVAVATPHNHPEPYDPSTVLPAPQYMPDTERLRRYLNKVYELQINAQIQLTVRQQVTLNFSVMTRESFLPCGNNPDSLPFVGNPDFDCTTETDPEKYSPEELAFAPLRDPNADINVYVLAGSSINAWTQLPRVKTNDILWLGVPAWGIAKRATREVWVDGDWAIADWTGYGEGEIIIQQVMHTMAHEMGHVIIGDGHPDDADEGYNGGPAPLLGTNRRDRLMVAGGGPLRAILPGTRLVKGEWDAAEVWLQGCPYPPISPPPTP